MVLLLSGTIYAILFSVFSQHVSIFNSGKNETPQALAVAGLRLYFLACSFIGFNIVTATYFTSTECPLLTQVISFLRGFFFLVSMAFLLSTILNMTGIWCAYPLTECIVTVVGIRFYTSNNE